MATGDNGGEPTGTIEAALLHARKLLERDPVLAAEQAGEILKWAPAHPVAMLILGLALGDSGQPAAALRALRAAVALAPTLPDAWRAIGDQLTIAGDAAGADAAYAQHLKSATTDPRLVAAGAALCENRIPEAESLLRGHLKQHPTDVAAIRMFAEVAGRLGRYQDAETLLVRCLELAPSFHGARHNYAIVLHRQNKPAQALRQINQLLEQEPRNPGYRNLQAVVLARLGDYRESIDIYADILATYSRQPAIWLSYGHALATAGREADSIAAYRHCIGLAPHFGEAYWSLANLKTFRFTAEETAAMLEQLTRADLAAEDRLHFEFAMGKASEDVARFADSFAHYARGNSLRREVLDYDADETSSHVRRSIAVLTAEFFATRAGAGCPAADPIFIVGLPRAGSTLVEQILASHPAVEGTMELPDIIALSRRLGARTVASPISEYPEVLASLSPAHRSALGFEYLERTRIQRKTSRAFFIDKMPNNFLHLGLIRLILPNARIIDARRHPMACCFSGFKQHFAKGQTYTYSLTDIARFYLDYVTLMEHFDAVLPGAVHRVCYENMIEDTESEVRRLLQYCGLPFDAACLRFHENARAVRTASAQQVRQPIFRGGLDQWRNFEPWLGPLRTTLGSAPEAYAQLLSLRN